LEATVGEHVKVIRVKLGGENQCAFSPFVRWAGEYERRNCGVKTRRKI